jgi:hypothetical protein
MKKNILLFFAFASFLAMGQQKKIKTLELNDTIIFATIDRPGDLYIITEDGQIQKFDKDGKLLVLYKHKTVPTIFDPRDGARLFAYYREDQEYNYFNPSFDITDSFRIDSAFAIEPWLIAPASDHKLWVLDAADHSLKKINPRESEVEVEVIIDSSIIEQASSFTMLREYQSFVFLLHPQKGIFIFNNLGKHIKTIEGKGIHHFSFLGEELYFLKNGDIHFFDLFTAENRYMLQSERRSDFALFSDERLILIRHKTIDIFEFKP